MDDSEPVVVTAESEFFAGECDVVIRTGLDRMAQTVVIPGDQIRAVLAKIQALNLVEIEENYRNIHNCPVQEDVQQQS